VTIDFGYAIRILPTLLRGAVITFQATIGGMALALVLGLVFVLLLRSKRKLIAYPTRVVLEFVRGTPLLIQLFFLFYVLPEWGITLNALSTGIFALGLHYSTYIAEVYRAGIESVPDGQWEAATALSLSRASTWRRIVLPQAVIAVLPMLGNYLVAMFKETPLLATITVTEMLGAGLSAAASSYRYIEVFTLIGLIFLALSLPAGALVRRLEVFTHRYA
jgi:polar amino acid transport system permease protein